MSFNQLGSSDIQTIATEVNKPWELSYCELINNGALKIYRGKNIQTPFNPNIDLRSHDVYERLIYHSINQIYYNQIDKSITTEFDVLGDITFDNDYYKKPEYAGIVRNFPTDANAGIIVLKFNKDIVGDLIKPKTFRLTSINYDIYDDGNGNVYNLIVNNKLLIGNIFYETGIVVITNPAYLTLFHTSAIAYNDTSVFLYNQPVKEIFPLANDSYTDYIQNSLVILNPDQYISVVNDKVVYTSQVIGTKVYYYQYQTYFNQCGALPSSVGQITIINYNKSGVFDYEISTTENYCNFDAEIVRSIDDDSFDYVLEILREACAFNATVTDISSLCGFILNVTENDSFCGFELNAYLIGDIIPTPTPTPTISLTPSVTPSLSVSTSVGITPTPTRTSTSTPTPTPTKSSAVVSSTPTPTPTRTPTPTPTRSSSNICQNGPKFFGPLTNLSSTGTDVSYSHIGVSSVKWKIIDYNNPLNIILSGTESPFFTSGLFDQIRVNYSGIVGIYKLRIEGGNCNSIPDEIDINIPGGATPTPTPTSTPGATPTPTPTPTRSPLAVCKTYRISPKPFNIYKVRYIDCNGNSQLASGGSDANPVVFYLCSLVEPANEGTSNALISLYDGNGCNPVPTTPTPTATPTPTPSRLAVSNTAVIMNSLVSGTVYSFEPSTGQLRTLFNGANGSDIAHTANKLFINNFSEVWVYNITLNPFTQTEVGAYTYASNANGAGLCAINDNTILMCGRQISQLTFGSGTVATTTTWFTLPNDSYCTGDIMYDVTNERMVISYSNSSGDYIGVFTKTGTLLRSATAPAGQIFGIYQYAGVTYLVNGDGRQWILNLSTLATTPTTTLNVQMAGASQLPSQISIPS